ncbi:MAG: Hsp70 family protein [Synergistaceae bacterium]|nr:Hsp70 family protein [Synergistaceae bacterium]
MRDDIVIGIDLGTRYAQLAADLPGRGVTLIPNRWGEARTPSIVAVSSDGLLAGEDAARLAARDPQVAWWDMKRHLGTDWVARLGGRTYTPEELLVPILSLLREDAEAYLKAFVTSCVLAAPAHFSFPERGALARAAQSAGFERIRIVNEPTAAALSIGMDGLFLIIDFGAGTLDLSLVEGDHGVFQVIDSKGRKDIGGYDLDRLLADWMCRRTGMPFSRAEDPRGSLMMREAEAVKIALSSAGCVTWRVPSGLFSKGRSIEISRHDFEALIRPVIDEVTGMVSRMWKKHKPQKLLVVGGSGRIPLLRSSLAAKVREPERLRSSPEDAVVTGTALYANQGSERLLIDVLSRSLGVMNVDGGVVQILDRGTPLPAEAKRGFTAYGNGSLEITIVQGEGKVKNLNRVLQTIYVENVKDGEVVDIFFRVDGGGLLHVEVKRKKKTSRKTISLESDETGTAPCDILTELRVREDRLAKLSIAFPDNFQQRLATVMAEARSLRNEDSALQWQALEVVDRMVAEIEQVVSP